MCGRMGEGWGVHGNGVCEIGECVWDGGGCVWGWERMCVEVKEGRYYDYLSLLGSVFILTFSVFLGL